MQLLSRNVACQLLQKMNIVIIAEMPKNSWYTCSSFLENLMMSIDVLQSIISL